MSNRFATLAALAVSVAAGCAAYGTVEPSGEHASAQTGGRRPTPAEETLPPLRCLAKYFGGTPTRVAEGWTLRFDAQTSFTWDDGKSDKSYDEKLTAPDLEDALSMRYAAGPAVVVTQADVDPGRIRHEGLFKRVFGATEADVEARLVEVDFVGQPVRIHEVASYGLARVSRRIQDLLTTPENDAIRGFVSGQLGSPSPSSYGIGIDLVSDGHSDDWETEKDATSDFPHAWKTPLPQALVDAFEAERFIWAGRWYHYDTKHFEYRPELFDPSCAPSE